MNLNVVFLRFDWFSRFFIGLEGFRFLGGLNKVLMSF